MENSPNLMNLAMMTAAVGMGVVFVALLLLSIYMSFFKRFIARLESRHARKSAPPKKVATAAPKIAEKVRDAAQEAAAASIATGLYLKGIRPASAQEALAASIAVGLHLDGVAPSAGAEVAVAIATALGLHRRERMAALAAPGVGVAGWGVAGRLDAHAGRMQMQSMQRQASVVATPAIVQAAPRARARRRATKAR